ncbi:Wall-associated receptor kinase-like 20 [Forsythia ovata]|uniref:Wall-associated receptor kinase-like 20 n=1 Tax=Forsythia ovata TaxID=205694 RepID=A0ABD1VKL4_9LAMI
MVSLIFLFVSLFTVQTFVSSLTECPKCGNMDVPYPLSTNENCGNPIYRIICNNGSLQFSSAADQKFLYKILSINPNEQKLVISPPHIEKNTCQSSDLSLGGFKIDENSPFNISSHNTVMLFNCSENILLSPLNCSSKSQCRQYEERVIEGNGCRNTLCCTFLKDSSMTSHKIRLRIGGCSAYTSVINLKPGDIDVDAWSYGIQLQWLPPPADA